MGNMIKTLSTKEVAKLFQLSPNRVMELAKAKEIPGRKIFSKWVFLAEDIARILGVDEEKL